MRGSGLVAATTDLVVAKLASGTNPKVSPVPTAPALSSDRPGAIVRPADLIYSLEVSG